MCRSRQIQCIFHPKYQIHDESYIRYHALIRDSKPIFWLVTTPIPAKLRILDPSIKDKRYPLASIRFLNSHYTPRCGPVKSKEFKSQYGISIPRLAECKSNSVVLFRGFELMGSFVGSPWIPWLPNNCGALMSNACQVTPKAICIMSKEFL